MHNPQRAYLILLPALLLATTLALAFVLQQQHLPDQPAPTSPLAPATPPPTNPEELGDVHWLRTWEEAEKAARVSGKPILILFQEVPGCSNCTHFGNNTLKHFLIVEAIETYFTPLCIYNNKGGKDAETLKRFGEPAWNNPVVRIVRPDGSDILPRMPEFRSSLPLVRQMRSSLDLSGVAVPQWLELLEEELQAREAGLHTATFSMYCFWSGEALFGDIPGVIETQPGFQNGKEVVQVKYDPARVSHEQLEAQSQPKGVIACKYNDGFRLDHEPKYYLLHSKYKGIKMTSLQACRVNSALSRKESPEGFLSPRQLN